MPDLAVKKSCPAFQVAWQSALAAGFCLGLPAGLVLWLVLLSTRHPSAMLERSVTVLRANGLSQIVVLIMGSWGWSFLLARISGYRPWWRIGLATTLGLIVSWFSPLSKLDGWLGDKLPVHTLYAVAMCGIVGGATLCVGLAYGLMLRNAKAALSLAFSTSLVSMLTLLLIIGLFDQFGIRVGGTAHLAMSKVTVTSLMASALTGGATLGVGFSRLVSELNSK